MTNSSKRGTETPIYKGAVELEYLREKKDGLIGLGAAVEWIAFRGMAVPEAEYDQRIKQATDALIEVLTSREGNGGSPVIIGVPKNDLGQTAKPLPPFVWAQTSTRVEDIENGRYVLLLLDNTPPLNDASSDEEEEEWGGSIESRDEAWVRLRITASFVLNHWTPDTLEVYPEKQGAQTAIARHKAYSLARVEETIRRSVADWPEKSRPLTCEEMVSIVKDIHPSAPRDKIRKIYSKSVYSKSGSSLKRGPRRGPRDPDRKRRVAEFREKMKSAELRN